jgi:predicted amidohydrolase YtcJ
VVAAVQPPFILSDTWLLQRLGPDRLAWAYPFRSMRAEGLLLAGSTDCPVEAIDAWPAVAAAVHRGGQNPSEALSLAEALDLFTAGSAAAAGEWERIRVPLPGYLLPGRPADFMVMDEDPFTLPADALAALRPVATVVAGVPSYAQLPLQ